MSGDEKESRAEEVTACFGVEKIFPMPFNSFEIGPFWMRTKVREGESAEEAMKRAYEVCCGFARKEYARKLNDFLARVQESEQAAAGRSRR